jgi:RND superfamily putative drug exporter
VQAVVGPARLASAVAPLREQGRQLTDPSEQLAQISRLSAGLSRARAGVEQVRGGIAEAAQGAGLLADGSDQAAEGAGLIAGGLGRARGGTERLLDALGRFKDGTERLVGVQERVVFGNLQLKTALVELAPNLRRNALSRSRAVQRSLNEQAGQVSPGLLDSTREAEGTAREAIAQLEAMEVGKGDPTYISALAAAKATLRTISGSESASPPPPETEPGGLIAGLSVQQAELAIDASESAQISSFLTSSIGQLKQLGDGASTLADTAQRILEADKELERGSQRLVNEVEPVGGQLERLATGATELAAGVARITGGSEALQENLARGYSASYPLEPGLRRAGVSVLAAGSRLRGGAERLRRGSPGLFDSGYFVLSALDGAPSELRERASEAVDLKRSGQAATLLVFSRYALNTPGSIAFQDQLEGEAEKLAKRTGLRAAVAGGPAVLNDYSAVTRERIPLVVAAITIATFLVLIFILRAIPLAALAVGLNLATVGVAFGILTLLTDLPADVPLGGRDYIDSVGATMIFGIVFGLSIDYAVFLLVRVRERYDRDGDHRAAITYGLEKTARVITGAAAIMLAVFIVFGGASIATVSQLGIGLTVAVFLDATVVRIVLLPALMMLIGERVWWLPRWLDRALPRINV